MELPQCMCFLDRKKCVNLLASLHNKFTCVNRNVQGVLCSHFSISLSHGSPLFGAPLHNNAI